MQGIAIVGCGIVGSSVAKILSRDHSMLQARVTTSFSLVKIVDINFDRAKSLGLDETLFEKNLESVLKNPSIHCVVELVGGTTFAKEVIERSLNAGKHVVTANKALLAHHGNELLALARKNNVVLAFEASCAGGIPVIRALYDGLLANRIDALFGIVNGTCNYILTQMTLHGKTYETALSEAQKKGFAEADPTLDVSGGDSAHKLAILAALAFGQKINLDAVDVTGIDQLELCDVMYGMDLGYVMKLLAISIRQDGGITLAVKPSFISREHPLAWVSGPFNAVSIYGHATGHTMYYGRGAGGDPTASAVISDILSVVNGSARASFFGCTIWPDIADASRAMPVSEPVSRFYIRVMASDEPGVLAGIASILAKYGISISSVLQKEKDPDADMPEAVPVLITTYPARQNSVLEAIREVDELAVVQSKSVCINIIDEHPEWKHHKTQS
ncbi:MAG: homoserine dehydrogenase [Spirochaetales bacterium]|nr:homoserine dehydrogenase [Spirochaetales bacterium]